MTNDDAYLLLTEIDLLDMFKDNNLTNGQVARLIGNNRKSVSKWLTGEKIIPYVAYRIIQHYIGAREITSRESVDIKELPFLGIENCLPSTACILPNKDQLISFIKFFDLKMSDLSDVIDIPRKKANLWFIGEKTIPYAVWAYLCHYVGIKEIWKEKQDN